MVKHLLKKRLKHFRTEKIFSPIFDKLCIWKNKRKCLLISILLSVVIFNEFVALHLASQSWQLMPSYQSSDDSVRILFVADSQILSTLTEPFYPFSLLFVWDANRFIQKSFNTAVSAANPNVLVFLGDQLNEGSIVDDKYYRKLMDEFHSIFVIPATVKKVVYIAGDNDIGGEGLDNITDHKISRFKKHFPSSAREDYKFVEFVCSGEENIPSFSDKKDLLRILLSHRPIMASFFNTKVVSEEQPSVIFSGHIHGSFLFSGLRSEALTLTPFTEVNTIHNFSLAAQHLSEVIVPTCSYRMGKDRYGFGLAVIERSKTMHYTVLWLPSRFKQLKLYVLTLLFILLCILLPRFLSLPGVLFYYGKEICCSKSYSKKREDSNNYYTFMRNFV